MLIIIFVGGKEEKIDFILFNQLGDSRNRTLLSDYVLLLEKKQKRNSC